jgi:hypothetical protein
MLSALRGSGVGLVFTLIVLGAMIALCAILLAPHLACRCVHRALRRRRLRHTRESARRLESAGQLT